MVRLGFSLIELMVVIAIVALLSAAAVPAYSSYMFKARVATLVNSVDSVVQRAIAYQTENGKFPSDAELPILGNLSEFDPYITDNGGYPLFIHANKCWGEVNFHMLNEIDNGNQYDFGLYLVYYEEGGIVKKSWFYEVWDASNTLVPGDLIPGMTNDTPTLQEYHDLLDAIGILEC